MKLKSLHLIDSSPVTYGSIQVWTTLPDQIRRDASLASFRREYDRRPSK